jgi:hypothetical protein
MPELVTLKQAPTPRVHFSLCGQLSGLSKVGLPCALAILEHCKLIQLLVGVDVPSQSYVTHLK